MLDQNKPVINKTENAVSPASLANDYAERLLRMQKRLDREISKEKVVAEAVKVPKKIVKRPETVEEKAIREFEAKNKLKSKVENPNKDLDEIPLKEVPVDKYSYVRSERAIGFRI